MAEPLYSFLRHFPFSYVQPGSYHMSAPGLLILHDHAFVEEPVVSAIGALPAVFLSVSAFAQAPFVRFNDLIAIIGMKPRGPEIVVFQKRFVLKSGYITYIVANPNGNLPAIELRGVERNRQ